MYISKRKHKKTKESQQTVIHKIVLFGQESTLGKIVTVLVAASVLLGGIAWIWTVDLSDMDKINAIFPHSEIRIVLSLALLTFIGFLVLLFKSGEKK